MQKPAQPDRAAAVYRTYYEHCRHFTPAALAYPQQATSAVAAARLFAGPPRRFRQPAYRGCLAGLRAGDATVDLKALLASMKEEKEEHGG